MRGPLPFRKHRFSRSFRSLEPSKQDRPGDSPPGCHQVSNHTRPCLAADRAHGAQELGVRNVTTPGLLAPLEMLADTKFSATLDPHFHELLHGHIDCDSHFWGLLPILFKRSLSVYLPVYSASTLAVQRSSLFTWGSSLSIIGKMFAASARSSAFLALYIASAHRGACVPGGWRLACIHLGQLVIFQFDSPASRSCFQYFTHVSVKKNHSSKQLAFQPINLYRRATHVCIEARAELQGPLTR